MTSSVMQILSALYLMRSVMRSGLKHIDELLQV